VQIDWFTFGAQLINFVVLIALLKRFLYGPILAAMDKREARIAARLDEAKAKREEAEQQAETYRALQSNLEAQRADRLAAADTDAEKRRQALIQAARDDIRQLEQEWREGLEREQQAFMHDLAERALRETIAVARRALNDLAGADLERRVIEVFLDQLRSLDADDQHALTDAYHAAGGTATLHVAFLEGKACRDDVQSVLGSQIGQIPDVAVKVDPGMGFGIELRIGDRTVGWNLDRYLTQLTDTVRERLEDELHPGPEAPPTPSFSSTE